MRHKQLKLIAVLLLGLGLTGLQAQNTVPASGGNASGSGGSSSFTVGQMVYTTNVGTTGSVAQGVQQPFEISIIDGVAEANEIVLSAMVYPNPATDLLTLKMGACNMENLSYTLTDINGKLLEFKRIAGNETLVEMKNYVNAIYFLKVIQGEKEIKSFKIVKN